MLGRILIGMLAVLAALAFVGFLQEKRNGTRRKTASAEEAEILPQKTVDNVLNLNDCFNRARYMNEDGV